MRPARLRAGGLLRDARAVRPLRAHAAVRGRARAGGRRAGGGGHGRSASGVDGRGLARLQAAGVAVDGGRPRDRGPCAEPRVPLRGDGRPAPRHAQGGHDARRQDRRGGRGVPVDHGGGGAARGPPAQVRRGRRPRGDRHGAGGRSPAHRAAPGAAREGAVPGRRGQPAAHLPAMLASSARGIPRVLSSHASRRRPPAAAAALRARGVRVLELPGTRAASISALSSRRCERWT